MNNTATWGPKGFVISANKIVPLMDLQTSVTAKAVTQTDANGQSQTDYQGRELQPISFSTLYLRAAGVDPRTQVEEWEALVGESYPLIIGGKRFGPANLMLKSVNTSDVRMANDGTFLQAKVSLTFEEKGKDTATAVSSTSSTSAMATANSANSVAAAVYNDTVAKQRALQTGAGVADRNAKKITRTVDAG